jgi:hypothetical protein
MTTDSDSSFPLTHIPDASTSDRAVARLVGEVYARAPVTERKRLLEYLLPSAGVLALVAVANGVFARIRFRPDWTQVHVRLEDAGQVQAGDIAALVERLQQASVESLDGLAQLVTASPILASSAAAALLVSLLVQRTRTRQADENDEAGAGPDATSPR